MAIQYSTTSRTNRATQLNTDIGVNALIKIYTGAPPANVGTAASGTLLVTLAGNATAFGAAASGVLTANAITGAAAAATGVAGYVRIATSGGTDVLQGTVATTGADFTINNTSINSGQTVNCSSLTITMGGA
jgi:hypothetical protein